MNMKNTYKHIAAALAFIAAVSCAKQEEITPSDYNQSGTYEYILNVTQENNTKVSMDGLSILWDQEDQIGVSCTYKDADNKNQYASVKNSGGAQSIANKENYTPSTSATFQLNLTEGYTPKAIGYPYTDNMKITSGGGDNNVRIDVNIPRVQIGILNNIPNQSFAMVGKVDDGECRVYNVGAVIQFEIKSSNITSLKFEGNNSEIISGLRYYYIENGNFAYERYQSDKTTPHGTTDVTLVPSGETFEPGIYNFVVSPNTLTNGFTLTLTNSEGAKAVRKTSSEFKIERNHKYTQFGSDQGWFKSANTLAAGDLGSANGNTATLSGLVATDVIYEGDEYGFETSTDGINWTKFEGEITNRFSEITHNGSDKTIVTALNTFTAKLTGLVPEMEQYYRVYYKKSNGIITYCKEKAFKTYAEAESVKIDLYNGWSEGYWPFTNLPYGTETGLISGQSGAAQHKGKEIELMTTTGTFVAKIENGCWLNAYNGCLTMQPLANDYLKFPVIKGKKPVCVSMTVGSVNGNDFGLPGVYKFEENVEPTRAGGGSNWDGTKAKKYDTHTWELINTDDSQYGIAFSKKNNCYISYLEVVYAPNVNEVEQVIKQDLVFVIPYGNHDSSTPNYNSEFAESSAKNWPFDGTGSPTKIGKWNDENIYFSATYPDFKYSFSIQQEVSGCFRITNAGLIYGGTAGDYMKIHPVVGYKLTGIKIRGGNKATIYSVKDSSNTTVTGGSAQTISSAYDSTIEFTLNNTSPNTEYRLTIEKSGSSTASSIREMWITYELAE